MSLEAMPDAPDEEWIRAWLDQSNQFNRQVAAALERGISTADNTTSGFRTVDLTHGQSITIANPLSVPIQGVWPVRCVGLTTGTDGKPNGGQYRLVRPDIDWQPTNKPDGSISLAPYFPTYGMTTGYAGETKNSFLASASAVSLTNNTRANINSLSLDPGEWLVTAHGQFSGAPTGTQILTEISTVSATGTDSVSGDNQAVGPTMPNANSTLTQTVASRPYSITATTTVYQIARALFSGGAISGYGRLTAWRTQPYMTGRVGRTTLFFFGG